METEIEREKMERGKSDLRVAMEELLYSHGLDIAFTGHVTPFNHTL